MLDVEDWAEIRRLNRAEGLSIKEITRRMGVARNTVRSALRSDSPPVFDRKPRPSAVDAVEPVVVEGRFTGTHEGMWRGLPGTGRRVDFPMCLVFEFEGDTMVNERIYFDLGTPLRQLGVAVDPNSPRGKLQAFLVNPVTLVKAIVRNALRRVRGRATA